MARVARTRARTVERSIYFYRAIVGRDDAGRELPFRHRPILVALHALPFSANGRYLDDLEGNAQCCWIDDATVGKLRFAQIRRTALPQVEDAGTLADLAIPHRSGLAEAVHVRFFPNNILGADFNFYGPRVTKLAPYFMTKAAGACATVEFEPLLRSDVLAQLDQLSDVRVLRLKVQTPYVAQVARASHSLGAALETATSISQADIAEIVLRTKPRSNRALSDRMLRTVKSLARLPGLRESVSKFEVQGHNAILDKVDTVDVLRDQLVSKKQIIRHGTRTRALDATAAYEAIGAAYDELAPELELAAAVG